MPGVVKVNISTSFYLLKLAGLCLGTSLVLMIAIWLFLMAEHAHSIPYSISQLHLMDCVPPCWIGIIPGRTTVQQAKARIVAVYSPQSELQIRDSGFADGYVASNSVENTIEGANFSLDIRLNIGELIDGRSETVQSIGLFETRSETGANVLTVADILGTFGAPRLVGEDETSGLGRAITLRYDGFDAVFSARPDRSEFDEIPRLYLGYPTGQISSIEYQPWKGLYTLSR